jgi:ectoine hydroxylase-related dioxygenase (phytanoyl-CoA dioxygenase family)
MKTDITQQQIDLYQENGFVLIEDFLSPAELQTWRDVTEDAVRQRLTASTGNWEKDMTNQGNPDDFYAQVFTQCVRLADTHDGMHQLMVDEQLGKVAATLAQIDGIRIWHDQALIKPPFGNATAWHLDNPYWSFSSKDSISIWVALDDATLHNGCMWYLPGTHKTARYDNVGIGMNMRDLFKCYPEWLQLEAVPAPARAGSAVFHNGLTAHGAGTNMTPRPRRAMTCAYMPDGSTFNGEKNILPTEYFNTLKVGDLLNDDTQNPLLWKKA